MYELRQVQIVRALDVLRNGPLTASQFSVKMWPDRTRSPGQQSQAGHALLRRLAAVGYVERIGDLWMIRRTTAVLPDGTADRSADGSAVELLDQLPVGVQNGLADRYENQPRLHRLVRMADAPVKGVTHDRALGDIAIRGEFLNCCLADACALVVLRGCSSNIYLPANDDEMLVGLRPEEAARALFLQWKQSGVPPELPHTDGWLFADDGFIAVAEAWRPSDADEEWWLNLDCVVERTRRQRTNAGLE